LLAAVDGEKAKASFKDGMLHIALPKQEKSKRKSIEVK
jgi:HSP20 family protein